jgi:Single-strand binding protein family
MASDNHTTIVGNLVEDPEVRFTHTGIAVTNLRVAVTQKGGDLAELPAAEIGLHALWGCAAVAAAACVAHSHVDDPRGDGGVLQPRREGVPQVMRAPQVQVAQVGPGRVHGGLVDPPQVVGPSRRRTLIGGRGGRKPLRPTQ